MADFCMCTMMERRTTRCRACGFTPAALRAKPSRARHVLAEIKERLARLDEIERRLNNAPPVTFR